jgi:hypothetical protein
MRFWSVPARSLVSVETMKSAIAAILAVAAGLVVVNMLGVAAAEAPTATPVQTVSVEGTANVPLSQDADLAAADAAYRQGMAAAESDGQGKAEFLATHAGTTLGGVQNIVEDGGSISCTVSEDQENPYIEYEGEQPDFGSGPSQRIVAAPEAAAVSTPSRRTHKRKKRHATAKKASATTCTLSAQVSLVYAIG